jgi:uncharacterized membrane protein
MSWNLRYRVKSYIRNALWIIPLVAVLLEQVIWWVVLGLDARLGWKGLGLGVHGAEEFFNAVTTLTLSFIVFTFGSLLVAIQIASGQYTPRIIATTLLRDNVIRYTAGIFVFTLIFSVKATGRMGSSVHQLVGKRWPEPANPIAAPRSRMCLIINQCLVLLFKLGFVFSQKSGQPQYISELVDKLHPT